jgi:hypothetical protein
MKELADFIRYLTPGISDKARYTFLSKLHLITLFTLFFMFAHFKNIYVRLFVLIYCILSIYLEVVYRECPATILEREFSSESWEDLLDIFFKYCGWDITRNEKIVGFTCFNIGGSLVVFTVIIHDIICAFFA